jgi:hypothetical protein
MTEILRAGTQKMLAEMIQQEVDDWLAQRAHRRNEQGRRQVVRNGYLPERELTTGVGPVTIRPPWVRDRRPTDRHSFVRRHAAHYSFRSQNTPKHMGAKNCLTGGGLLDKNVHHSDVSYAVEIVTMLNHDSPAGRMHGSSAQKADLTIRPKTAPAFAFGRTSLASGGWFLF